MERRLDKENLSLQEEGDSSGYTTVHLGSPGPLHSSQIREIPNNSPLKDLMKDSLSFDDIVSLAAMFNFADEGWLIGQRKVVASPSKLQGLLASYRHIQSVKYRYAAAT